MGKIYKNRGDFDKASEYTQISLDASRTTGHKIYEAMNLQTIAQISYSKENPDYDLALQYAEESVRLSEENNFKGLIIASWNTISNVYLKKKQFKESEEFAFKAWQLDSLNLSTNINPVATDILYNLAIINVFLGNKEKSAYFLQKYHTSMLQYNDRDFHQLLTDMEIKYETEKKEMRIASLEKERQLYVWLSIVSVILVIALGVVLHQKIKNVQKEKQLIAPRSVLDGEMGERTRLTRDLHDRLSGNLAAVKIGLNDNKESLQSIYDKLDSCIDEIRRVSHNLMPAPLRLGLKATLDDFVAQFSNVYFHFFGTEQVIEERVAFVLYCCASELVNNSLRHSGAKKINMQLVQSEKYISLTIQDDGSGFDEKSATKGMGLKNIYDRVASCNGKIDIVTSLGKGTEITIELKIGGR